MTVTQILLEVAPFKPMSAPTLYKHLKALKIEPVGNVRQCPQVYPADTPKRILKRLGITVEEARTRKTPQKAGAR